MGRAPCCDKANVKKGPWSPEEDAKLKSYIEQHGTGGNWIALPQKIGLKRCGKSCRLRWLNYLRPNIKHGGFSEEEDNIICSLYISIGSRWSIIAAQLPGRTDNDIKNYWNTRLKKKLLGKQRKEHAARRSSIASQKQKERENGTIDINGYINMLSSSSHHPNPNPYWPQMPPIPYSNEEPRFNDHASIRKLLIKLGGRFSSDQDHPDDLDQNAHEYTMNPIGTDSIVTTVPFYDDHQQISMLSAAEGQYIVNVPDFANPVDLGQGSASSSTFQAEIEEMMFNNPQKLDGLEFLCGDNRVGNLESWGEMMSSMVLPAPVNADSSFESSSLHQQGDCCAGDDQDLRYHGL